MIIYLYDSYTILAEAIKNKTEEVLNWAYDKIYKIIEEKGYKPKFHRVDNELSEFNKICLATKNIEYEIVPPYNHQRNKEEREIRTFANHLIAGLKTAHEYCPFYLWEELLQQAIITVTLLQASILYQQYSSYHSFFDAFDFTKTPLALLGMKVIALISTQIRTKWEQYGSPAMDHYRC